MFLGTHTPRLDDKGRLTMPAKFRDQLAGGVMVTRGQDRSLSVWPREPFLEVATRASEAQWTDPVARGFVREFAASAEEQRPDAQGRIIISARHREWAGLHKACVVNGAMKFLEIWDEERWEAYRQSNEETFASADSDSLRSIF